MLRFANQTLTAVRRDSFAKNACFRLEFERNTPGDLFKINAVGSLDSPASALLYPFCAPRLLLSATAA
jgi:hypothetical protein